MSRHLSLVTTACVALGAAVLVFAGCTKKVAAPPPPPEPLPPGVAEVFPAPRATGVFYDTDIWVRFTTALDPSSVNDRNVFLKLDTQRLVVDLTYEPAMNRIRIRPRGELLLRRTYTIELTPRLETAEGGVLGQTLISQFTTNGLRRFQAPLPDSASAAESPFVTLFWTPTPATGGSISYQIYAGLDSAAVAARTGPAIERRTAFYLPGARWPAGARVYWAVTAINETASEMLDSPVWWFDTVAESTPIDSLTVTASAWAAASPNGRRCHSSLQCGGSWNCALQWHFDGLPDNLRLAGCLMRLVPSVSFGVEDRNARLHAIVDPWSECEMQYGGPPTPALETLVQGTFYAAGPRRYEFVSDSLTTYVETLIRKPEYYGFMLFLDGTTTFADISSIPVKVYYYRLPPMPLTARP